VREEEIEHRARLFEAIEALAQRQVDPVRRALLLVPSRADTELRPPEITSRLAAVFASSAG
jgi:hypothetical protein